MINQSNLDKLVQAALNQRNALRETAFDGILKILKNYSDDSTSTGTTKIVHEALSYNESSEVAHTPSRSSSNDGYTEIENKLSKLKSQSSMILKSKDNHGRSLVYLACLANDLKLIQLLLAFGASEKDFLEEDDKGLSPLLILLHHFNKNKDTSILCYLFTHKILQINSKYINNATLLHFSAYNNDNDLCQLLLLLEAEVDTKDLDGHTALHYACMQNSKEVAEALLISNAGQKSNNKGQTPSDIADLYCADGVLKLLAAYPAYDHVETQESIIEKSETETFSDSPPPPPSLPGLGLYRLRSASFSYGQNSPQAQLVRNIQNPANAGQSEPGLAAPVRTEQPKRSRGGCRI